MSRFGNVVDLDVDPLVERRRRRRTVLRVGLPLCGVGLIIGFLFGIAIYAERANRAGVLGLSDSLLQSLRDRISLQVAAYLEPAVHGVLLAHSMLGRDGSTSRAAEADVFATSVLHETPQVANVLFADAAGDFILVTRAPDLPGGTLTKRIEMSSSGRTTTWTTRSAQGTAVAVRDDPADTYDARGRAWYLGARGSDDVFWTSPYIFFTERKPGVTVAVHGPDADPDVVGIDIRLDALSGFLRNLAVGQTGKAYIVSRNGDLIAGPDPAQAMQVTDGQPRPSLVGEAGDAELTATWDHYRVEGIGTRVIEAGGKRLISIVTPLSNRAQDQAADASAGQDWLLAITVPESDFSGFVLANSQRAGLLSLVVVALAVGLGLLLARQGMRADRADRVVAERSRAVRIQGDAFARMATAVAQATANGTPPPALTEVLTEATGAGRASLWAMPSGQYLRCQDSYDVVNGGHVAGLELSRQEVEALLDALAKGEPIEVADARRDRRTVSLHSLLMASFGSKAVYIVPVIREARVLGMVMLEDAPVDAAVRTLASACANLLAVLAPSIPATASQAPMPVAGEPASRSVAPPDDRQMDTALAALPSATLGVPHAAAHAAEQAVILLLRLPATVLANPGSDTSGSTLGHQIACAAQEIAQRHGIPYLKMLGPTIVAAAGPVFDRVSTSTSNGDAAAGDPADPAQSIAAAAIEIRERCADLFEDIDGVTYSLGLDAGRVSSGLLGAAPGLFNIWGETLEGARSVAESAPEGTVQVTEAAYLLLRNRFLFRPRGLFHRPGFGDVRSYVLGGQI